MLVSNEPKVTSIAVGTQNGNATLFLFYSEKDREGISEIRVALNIRDMAKLAELGFRVRNV